MTVITVSQLNRYVKSMLESDPRLTTVYISGEISNFTNHYKTSHYYLSLKDETALVKAVMFRSYASKLAFMPENGMKVIVKARVSLYEKDGAFQIYIEDMQPDGVGALQVAYEQLKTRLAEEGLFDEARKRPIPRFPLRIGVITSPTGAAVRDILNVLGRRYPLAQIVFVPVLVQGADAPPQLVQAVKRMNETRAADVIIIGRGGGSIEELWAFNDEQVARAVAASAIPVISAVGHETDFTICDFAADLRAPTPSAAAELAVPEQMQLISYTEQLSSRAVRAVRQHTINLGKSLDVLRGKRCLSTPLFYVEDRGMRLDYLTKTFAQTMRGSLAQAEKRLTASAGKLDVLSPLKVLGRGYALVQKDGKTVHSTADVTVGNQMDVRLTDGVVVCTVDETRRESV